MFCNLSYLCVTFKDYPFLPFFNEEGSDDGSSCPIIFDVDSKKVRLSGLGPLLNCSECNNRIME